jgi:hypothetical protein
MGKWARTISSIECLIRLPQIEPADLFDVQGAALSERASSDADVVYRYVVGKLFSDLANRLEGSPEGQAPADNYTNFFNAVITALSSPGSDFDALAALVKLVHHYDQGMH